MAEMGRYCKAYYAKDLKNYSEWNPNLSNLAPEEDEHDPEKKVPRRELLDDDVLYLQENHVVTDGIMKDEFVIFDAVTDDWKKFCETTLEFEIPDFEPMEVPEN